MKEIKTSKIVRLTSSKEAAACRLIFRYGPRLGKVRGQVYPDHANGMSEWSGTVCE